VADIGVFPRLVGQGWSTTKTPTWQTRIQRAVSGRELRALDYPNPLWQFTLTYEALGDGNNGQPAGSIGSLLYTDLRTLMGFFMACQGAFGTFLYDDPSDDSWSGTLAVSDGVTTTWQLYRTMQGIGSVPGFTEAITAPGEVTLFFAEPSPAGYVPIKQAAGEYSVNTQTGVITLATPAPAGWAIVADFTYYFRCRFMSDAYDFENFMFRLWSLKRLDFISVIA
jgi:uncharacterized protein (TIGR02217 family)